MRLTPALSAVRVPSTLLNAAEWLLDTQPWSAEEAVPRIIAEIAEPIRLELEAREDPRFPVELSVRVPEDGATRPLALRYTNLEQATRSAVAYQERLSAGLAELHDALAEGRSSSVGWSRFPVALLIAAVVGIFTTLLVPELRSEHSVLFALWVAGILLALGLQWVHSQEHSVELVAAGDTKAVAEGVRAVLVLLDRPLSGAVLTPAVRLEDAAGAAVGYVVPAAVERGVPKRMPLDAMAHRAKEEIEQPRLLRDAEERRRTERRQLESGVEEANRTLEGLRELSPGSRPSAEP